MPIHARGEVRIHLVTSSDQPPIKTSGSIVWYVVPTLEVHDGGQKPSHPFTQLALTTSLVTTAPLTATGAERWKHTSPADQVPGAVPPPDPPPAPPPEPPLLPP